MFGPQTPGTREAFTLTKHLRCCLTVSSASDPFQGCTREDQRLFSHLVYTARADRLKLIYLLHPQAVTMAGDGYRGRMSPHTPNEKFEGATVLKTLRVLATRAA